MELSTPHTDQPLLLGLAVYQNLHKLEHARSIHIHKKGDDLHTIQQEFSSKGRIFTEMGTPTHVASGCDGEDNLVQDYMKLTTTKQEREGWKCLLDFCATPPRSPSPLTAAAMLVASAWSSANALIINANNTHESCPIDWDHPQCILPSLSACLNTKETFQYTNNKLTCIEPANATSQRLQLDLWQEWGSDLELASPRLSKTFELPLLKNNINDVNMPIYGGTFHPASNMDSLPWAQTHLGQSSLKMLTVMAGHPQSSGGAGMNVIGVACAYMSPDSTFDANLGEASATCNVLENALPLDLNRMAFMNLECSVDMPDNRMDGDGDHIPFECDMNQPMSSTSITYSSSDERRSIEAENSEGHDQLRELDGGGSNSIRRQREAVKFNKPRSSRVGRLSELTKDELTHYFNMPIIQASKELNVGLTVLKKHCRIFGIPRWPHRKMKSINGLIRNIQVVCDAKDLVKGDGENKDMNRVQFAVEELEKQKKEMQECPGIQLPEKTKRLRQACFKASYRRRRQALNDDNADVHHAAPATKSNGGGSNNSSTSNSFHYPYCEERVGAPFCPK